MTDPSSGRDAGPLLADPASPAAPRQAAATAGDTPRDEQVRLAAYYLYLARGERPGQALEDWLAAEAMIFGPAEQVPDAAATAGAPTLADAPAAAASVTARAPASGAAEPPAPRRAPARRPATASKSPAPGAPAAAAKAPARPKAVKAGAAKTPSAKASTSRAKKSG